MLSRLRPPSGDGCVSDLTFARFSAGELAPDELSSLEAHLAGCDACTSKKRQLAASDAAFLAVAPTLAALQKRAVPATSDVVRPRAGRAWRWFSAGAAVAAAAALVLVVHPPSQFGAVDGDSVGTRLKGGARMGFFVARGGAVFRGQDSDPVYPGDRLRFVLSTNAPRHVAILSRDGAGVVSVYYPAGTSSARFEALRDYALDSSIELDDTLGEETIYALFCAEPFELLPLRQELERAATLSERAGCTVDTLRLTKQAGP
jgi:Putative zinc-finger